MVALTVKAYRRHQQRLQRLSGDQGLDIELTELEMSPFQKWTNEALDVGTKHWCMDVLAYDYGWWYRWFLWVYIMTLWSIYLCSETVTSQLFFRLYSPMLSLCYNGIAIITLSTLSAHPKRLRVVVSGRPSRSPCRSCSRKRRPGSSFGEPKGASDPVPVGPPGAPTVGVSMGYAYFHGGFPRFSKQNHVGQAQWLGIPNFMTFWDGKW